jgi:hypothetical protein
VANLPAPWAVSGSPIGYAAGPAEQEWKARIRAVVPAAPPTHAGSGLFADFRILPPTTTKPGFDLDNLLDPVLSAVINGQGWFGGSRPTLRWVAAQKQVAAKPGLRVSVLEQAPRLWTVSDPAVALDDVYSGELPESVTDKKFVSWAEQHMRRRLVRGKVGIRLDFADDGVNLGDVATGKFKVLIDGLWPILGVARGAPAGRPVADDKRVAALIMRKEIADLGGTVAVNVVGLPDGWPNAGAR